MRSKYLWKFNFFWDSVENAKNDANISKIYFLGFSLFFFAIFWFFLKIYQNIGQKLDSNKENDGGNKMKN